jgi:digeranylgeranylglycerophospholipid reductase
VLDVAIVGAGPAGLHAAARCADAGLSVLVLEEHPAVGSPVHCTGIVSVELTEFVKIPDSLILARLTRARLSSPGRACCEFFWAAGGSEEILAIDRGEFDQHLAGKAAASGARLETGAPVDGVAVDPEGVALSVRGRVIRARAGILACGVSYRLQRLLGLGLPASLVHTAQVEVEAEPSATVELHVGRKIARDGFLWVVPVIRGGRHALKIGAMGRGDVGGHLQHFLARPDVRGRFAAAPARPVRRLLPLSPIAKTYADRLLVIGDAGGFTKPTTGGGIFFSLLTASLAADTLVEAFAAGRLDEAFLGRYERRWQERLGQELRVASWLRQVLVKCTDAELDTLVHALAADDVQEVIRVSARFNWHRDVILALVRQPGIASLLFRSLFR